MGLQKKGAAQQNRPRPARSHDEEWPPSCSSRWGEGSTKTAESMEMATILFRSLRPTFAKAFAGVLATDGDDQSYLAREAAAQADFNEPGGAAPPRYLP